MLCQCFVDNMSLWLSHAIYLPIFEGVASETEPDKETWVKSFGFKTPLNIIHF